MNRYIGIGRLVKAPTITYTQGEKQTCIARYTIAVDRRFKQEGQPEADFISCVAFGKQGEFAEKYLKKGIKIAVTGELRTGSYTNKDGQKVYTTDVVVNEHEFVESKKQEENTQEEPIKTADGYMDIPEGIENDLPFK